jgi:hypothetical protein
VEPVGPWRLLDAGGAEYATVSFAPLTESSLGMGRRPDLGQVAVAQHAWEQAPWPDALADVHDVGWAEMDTFFGGARHFPFLLKGLAQPDRLIFDLALGKIAGPVLHQGTIAEVAGPVVRYLVALAPGLADEREFPPSAEFPLQVDWAALPGSGAVLANLARLLAGLREATRQARADEMGRRAWAQVRALQVTHLRWREPVGAAGAGRHVSTGGPLRRVAP